MSALYRADRRKTHAVVVGIDRFPSWGELALTGPVEEACQVTQWLLRRGVPPGQIKLFLSPLDQAELAARKVDGVSLADLAPRLPKSTEIQETLNGALTRCDDGELLFFFWFGHGVIRMNHNAYLFYADASPDNPYCCDMDSLVTSLRSSRFLSFGLQIFVIDACQDYVEYDEALDAALTNQPFRWKKPPAFGRRQLQLYSTFPGSRAQDLPAEGEASFCRRLLEALKTEPEEPWPPRMEKVVWSVKSLFLPDRPDEQPEQMPVVRYVGWETDSFDYLREWGPPAAHPRVAKERSVPDGRMARLTDCLRRVAVLQEADRKTILQYLPQAVDVLLSAQKGDFYESLAAVSAQSHGGLEVLTEVLHEFGADDPALKALDEALDEILPQTVLWGETGELKDLLRGQQLPEGVRARVKGNAPRSGPKDWVACRGRSELSCDLDRLARCSLVLEGSRRQALLEFVEELLPGLGAEVRAPVEEWLSRVSHRLNVQRTMRAGPPAPATSTASAALLVHLVPKGALRDPRGKPLYELQGWLVRASGKTDCVTPRENAAAFEDLDQVVAALLDNAFELLDYEPVDLTVQFFVRRALLAGVEGGDLDRLMIDVGTVLKKPLGVKHSVVLRSAERTYEVSRRSWPAWRERWRARPLPPQCATEANIFRLGRDGGNLDIRLEQAGPMTVCLAPSLLAEPGSDSETLRRAGLIVDVGTPIGLWFRRPVQDLARAESELDRLVRGQPLDELPRRVRQARAAVWEQTPEADRRAGKAPGGNPVVLLWDDPTLLPPDARKPGAFRQPQ